MTESASQYQNAIESHREGRLEEAISLYQASLADYRDDVASLPVWRMLAQAQFELGSLADAIDSLEQCLTLNAADGQAAYIYANLERNQGNIEHALELYRLALEFGDPAYTCEVAANFTNILIDTGQFEEAVRVLLGVLTTDPDFAEGWNNLGSAYLNSGRFDDAVDAYRKCLAVAPGMVMAANNIGSAFLKSGRPKDALTQCTENTELFPDHPGSWSGLGNILVSLEMFDEAIEAYNRSLELNADQIDAMHGRAIANHHRTTSFGNAGHCSQALADYQQVALLRPLNFHARYNMGSLLQVLGRHDEAIDCFRRVLEINPQYVAAHSALAHSMQQRCRWENLAATVERVYELTREEMTRGTEITTSPFNLLQLSAPGDVRLAAARQQASVFARTAGADAGPGFSYRKPNSGRMRIGYISPDFRGHSVGRAFVELLTAHDHDKFEIFGYFTATGTDDVTARLITGFDHFREFGNVPFSEAARTINEDGIDILVDLAGHTRGNRYEIMALRPAPVQAHFLGYGFTTGADYIDWLLTDEITIPEKERPFVVENIVYLPHHSLPASQPEISAKIFSRKDFGLPEDGFVYADFNGHYKIDSDIFSAWMRILRKAPDAVLWLMDFGDSSTANLKREAQNRGVEPSRLVFARHMPSAEHLARLQLADLALDTWHHAGGVTTTDALWAGLPVLSLLTDQMVDRTGASLMSAAELPELVAQSIDDYMRKALSYYRDRDSLIELKQTLRQKQTSAPLFDTPGMAGHLEIAYQKMWKLRSDKEMDQVIFVGPEDD
jgi:protein O-GlcNAc transferase